MKQMEVKEKRGTEENEIEQEEKRNERARTFEF